MIHLLHDWFGWPDGAVLTNLIASAIGFTVGYFAAVHRKIKNLHKKIDDLHEKQDRLHQHLGVEDAPVSDSPE